MIEDYAFGRITVNGKVYTSDIIIAGSSIHSWWRKQGHVLNPEDLTSVLKANPQTLVVGTGAYGLMKIPEKTEKFLKRHNITLIAEKTGKAVGIFNNLTGEKAAALHLTC
ncbi:MAG: hypothetical protein HXS46_08730 [Theionarchaea archaeon]|nr:hypothetical protein [Theionarchaea archaeon]